MTSSPSVFAPSAAQRRLLDYIHDHPGYQPTRDLCRAAGVPRASYYRWCRDDAFRAWFGSAWLARLAFDGVALLNMARAQAPEKASYWKALADLVFDPKGVGALAKWSASLAALAPDAFLPAPAPHRRAPAPPPPAPPQSVSRRLTEAEWNQRYGVPDETLPPSSPSPSPASVTLCRQADRLVDRPAHNPVQSIKLLARSLGKIRSVLAHAA